MRRYIVPLALAAVFLLAACSPQPAIPPTAPRPVFVASRTRVGSIAATATKIADAPTSTPLPTPTGIPTTTTPPASPLVTETPTQLPTAAPTITTFAAVGDYGWSGPGARGVAALVNEWDPDLVLTLGDNNYPNGAPWTIEENITANYGRFVAAGRFFPSLGNHDMTTNNGHAYFDYFDLPGNERYYDFVRGEVHFFSVNSDWREPDGISAGSAQAVWLRDRLASSTAAWQVIYFHAPPFVSFAAKQVPVMDWPFAAWGADLVLSGHAHLYERLELNGLTYIVNGLGGHTIYPFDEIPHPGSRVRYNADFGALFVEATAGSLHGRFISRTGDIIDTWSVTTPHHPQ